MSLQDVFLAHLYAQNLNPSTSLESDWTQWTKEVREREAQYATWLARVRSSMSSSQAEALQVEKFTEKFKSSLSQFNYLFDKDPILNALRHTWIPQIDTRFNLKYDLQLELEDLSEKNAEKKSFDPSMDETDTVALEQEIINHRENVQKWSVSLLNFLKTEVTKQTMTPESQEESRRLIKEIETVLEGLKKLGDLLAYMRSGLTTFHKLKQKLWEDTQDYARKLSEVKSVPLQPSPSEIMLQKEKTRRERLAKFEMDSKSIKKTVESEDPIQPTLPTSSKSKAQVRAENITLLFDRASIRMLKERLRTQESYYKLRKTEWISNLRLLLLSIVSLLMESKLKQMTRSAYSSGFVESVRQQEAFQKFGQMQRDLVAADRKFHEQKDKIKAEADYAIRNYKVAIEEYKSLLDKSRERAKQGVEDLAILRGLHDAKKWNWTKTTPAIDFALKLIETLGGESGDVSTYRLKKIPLENSRPDEMCVAKFSDDPSQSKYTARPYQVLLGLLGDADMDVQSMVLLHRMGSGKSLTFSEFLVRYIQTANPNTNKAARNALILAPQSSNMHTWARELLEIRFIKEDIADVYNVKSAIGVGVVSILLEHKTQLQAPFLILITVFSKHLGKASSFVRNVIKEAKQTEQWSNLEELVDSKNRDAIVKSFYASGVDEMYNLDSAHLDYLKKRGRKELPELAQEWFNPWEVAPKSKEDFVCPLNGVCCIDEVQNMVNPKDWNKRTQETAMTWALAIAQTGGKKLALTGTPALDFTRPMDIFKAFNIITQVSVFPSGVWVAPMTKDARLESEFQLSDMTEIETKYLTTHVFAAPEEWSAKYYTKLLISAVDLESDPTTYARERTACSFPDLSQTPPPNEEEKCEEAIGVESNMETKRLPNSNVTKSFRFNVYPTGGLPATRVLVFPLAEGRSKGFKAAKENQETLAKFLAIHHIIQSLPKEKHFVFLDANTYNNGTQHTLQPLIAKKKWTIPSYGLAEASDWLRELWQDSSFWTARKKELETSRETLDNTEKRNALEIGDLKRLLRQTKSSKNWTSTAHFADIWYEVHRLKGQTEKKMLPLTFMSNMEKETSTLLGLYDAFKKFERQHSKKKDKDKDKMEGDEDEEMQEETSGGKDSKEQKINAARAFLFNFFVDLWNHPDNDFGAYFSTLLGDIQTKEGLSFLNTRCLHFVKVPRTRSMWLQVIARNKRLCSMMRAYPDTKDWVVKSFLYFWADKENQFGATKNSEMSNDTIAFQKLQQVEKSPDGKTWVVKKAEIETLMELLQRNAIDCTFFAEYNYGLSADVPEDRTKLERLCRLPFHKAQAQVREILASKRPANLRLVACPSEGNKWILEAPDGKGVDVEKVDLKTPNELPPPIVVGCSVEKTEVVKNLGMYGQADETLYQLLTKWLTQTSSTSSIPESSFLETLLRQKSKLKEEGVITEANSAKLLQGFLVTSEVRVDTLFSQMNSMIVEDQMKLAKFLSAKRSLSVLYDFVDRKILEVYTQIAEAETQAFFKKFQVLSAYETAKREVRKVPVPPQGGTPEVGILSKEQPWEYLKSDTVLGKQVSSELATIFPS